MILFAGSIAIASHCPDTSLLLVLLTMRTCCVVLPSWGALQRRILMMARPQKSVAFAQMAQVTPARCYTALRVERSGQSDTRRFIPTRFRRRAAQVSGAPVSSLIKLTPADRRIFGITD